MPRFAAKYLSKPILTVLLGQIVQLFRVENVAIGIWIDIYKRQYLHRIEYVNDPEFLNRGCRPGYAVAHGQNLKQMLCLWKHLQKGEGPLCCDELVTMNDDWDTRVNKTEGAR